MNTDSATASTETQPQVPRRYVTAFWKGVRKYTREVAWDLWEREDEMIRLAGLACRKWEARHGRRPTRKQLRAIAAVFAATEELPELPHEYFKAFWKGLLKYNPDLAWNLPGDEIDRLAGSACQDLTARHGRRPSPKEVMDMGRLFAITAQLAAAGIDVSGFEDPEDYIRAMKDPRLREHLDESIKASEREAEEAQRDADAAKQDYRDWKKGKRENKRLLKKGRKELAEMQRELEQSDKRISNLENEKRQADARKRQTEQQLMKAEEQLRFAEKDTKKTYDDLMRVKKEMEEVEAERRRHYYREP